MPVPPLGAGLEPGPLLDAVPQGVTLVTGPDTAMARLVRERVTAPGTTLADLAQGIAGARIAGFRGPMPFLPEDEPRPVAPPDVAEAERAVWQAAEVQDSVAAYRGYLDRYPSGLFAEEARAAIAAIQAEPERAARLAEEALGLERPARRQIQEDLTVLDHNPRGIDGIFGPGTRAAIARFQAETGFPVTGYLESLQIERLALQAERRRAEIEAEAERRRLEQERQDRATWAATGAAGDEAGLRTYLRRWPAGLFAEVARAQLEEIEAAKRAEAEAAARIAWEAAEADGSREALESFLRRFPDSSLAGLARRQLDALDAEVEAPPEEAPAGAQAAEAQLGLPQITLILVERRLQQLGMEPGQADGVLDADSRGAIARFQAANGLPETGYLSTEVLAAMLLDLGSVIAPRSD
ncbi:MAG: peptidoglycan-binding protein [Pseudomonadota bacterium]